MERIVYLNGQFISGESAAVSIDNGGWLHGAGLFETIRAENRHAFRLARHLDRMCASAARLLAPVVRAALPDQSVIGKLMQANELTDARIRVTLTAGSMQADAASHESPLTLCATAAPLESYPAELYDRGVTVLISRYRQSPYDPLAGHKTTSHFSRLLALAEAQVANCNEALWFTPENLLAEGSISNVFIVKSGKVITPPLDTPVLPGIARAVVLEICASEGIRTEMQPVTIDNLLDADEVFLTNVIMQVMPVCRIEQRDIAGGAPGPIASRLLRCYGDLVARECSADAR